jgi:hypothetical protein
MRRLALTLLTVAIPVAVVVVLAFGLAACGGDGSSGSTPTATVTVTATPTAGPTEEPSATMTVSLYFLRGETLGVAHRVVSRTLTPAHRALDLLLAGPNAREKAAGLSTAIPPGAETNILIYDADTRVLTVDLTSEFAEGDGALALQARVAQVVYTMTQFPTIKAVRFRIEGKANVPLGGEGLIVSGAQGRADWEALLPPIFVESPAVGDVVGSPVTVRGSAMVFEATFAVELLDARGDVLQRATVTASAGAPERGRFSVGLSYMTLAGRGTLRVYDESEADGSIIFEARVPLRFAVSD